MAEISARKRIWGWYWFDWASQPYHTLLLTFVFGPFFAAVGAEHFMSQGLAEEAADAKAQSMWSWGLALAGLIVGFGAPIMGALADTAGRVRPWVAFFALLYVVGAGSLWWTQPDGSNLWAMIFMFALGFIGAEFALVFTNSQLPSLADKDEVGEISGSGFAFGYVGGLIALAIMLVLFMEQPNGKTLVGLEPGLGLLDAEAREGTRIVGPFVALWFAIFMIPYALWVKDVPKPGMKHSLSGAFSILGRTIKGLRHKRSLASYLGSSMFYRDALNGLYGFGGVYASLVLNWSIVLIGIFGIIAGIAAALFSWLGGRIDGKHGPKPVIIGAILVLIAVCVLIVNMTREAVFGIALPPGSSIPDAIFFGCGILIGGMGGTLQSASRSMMVRHADPNAPTESFGLYGLSGRATAFMAPALIAWFTTVTGSARLGVSPLIGLFLLGLILLIWVKPDGEQ
ncbi:MFS transporter [Aliiroseovarius sp. F20344]|uniref:MFS transporter n=1 Tax=Aliiroseovarius sp. F20344 TaxID=2926414 RepID=UPI001FF41247|nr:MFS transporter [Aliiroseovarius sp. F20344]MCK0141016.1 MFS transporter [Aliiroseovarius sp. F20344]